VTSSTEKLRVLVLNSVGYEGGGAELIVSLMVNELRARGNEVLMVSTDHKLKGQKPFADVIIPRRTKRGRLWYQYAYDQITAAVDEFKPDVIHLHTIGEFGRSALWATGTVPTVLTVHGPEPYTRNLLQWMLPGRHFRGSTHRLRDVRAIGALYYLYLLFLQRPLYRRGFRFVDVFVAPSAFMAKALAPDVGNIPIEQVYNGTLFPRTAPFHRNNNVLFVGRLEATKGVDYLLRAVPLVAKQVDGLSVTIAGDGEDRARLEKLSADLGLDEIVQFRGWIQRDEVVACYDQAEVIVIPSVWPETLGTVALDAMAAGRPAVSSVSGGLPEVVIDGVTGILVPRRNSQAVADALISILTNPETAERMSAACLENSSNWQLAEFIDKTEEIYSRLVSKASEPA
jgi:glycosyltransferase involved in cell wall biosynthesis